MTRLVFSLALVCCTVLASTGCATILAGADQTVSIESYPPGARVSVGHHTGITPVTFHVPKGKDYAVRISQGPDERVVPLNRALDPLTLLNIIPPLWPGFIVDAATGALTKYEPNVISVDFRTAPSTPVAQLVGSGG